MQKLSIVRFKPKPENYKEFIKKITLYHNALFSAQDHYLMTKGDEVVAVVVRDASTLQEKIDDGINWLDTVRPLLLEYNDADRHTIAMTGDLIEK